jgi:hypothetical protein
MVYSSCKLQDGIWIGREKGLLPMVIPLFRLSNPQAVHLNATAAEP